MDGRGSLIENVKWHHLQNGLRVLVREDHTVPVVASMIWYGVGSRFEGPGIRGISHFLEHMLFKGTDRYEKGEIDLITTCQGGSNNAFTSNDYTAYYFSFASDRWWPALEIESNRMTNNRFDPIEFELERQVVIEELKMDLDTPWGALCREVEIQSYSTHPYKNPVIGVHEDLVAISPSHMVEYYRHFYVPNNATLVVVGDFRTDQVLERIQELFGGLPQKQIPAIPAVTEPRRAQQVRIDLQRPTRIPRLIIALPAPGVRNRQHYAVPVLDKILSEGKLSRLYKKLVEEAKVASSVTTDFSETYDPYLFFIRAELCERADPAEAETLIFEEIASLAGTPIPDGELERAKNQCLTQFAASFETALDQAMQLGLMETIHSYEYWYDYPDQIRHLTSDQVGSVAKQLWTPEQATVGVLSPNS